MSKTFTSQFSREKPRDAGKKKAFFNGDPWSRKPPKRHPDVWLA